MFADWCTPGSDGTELHKLAPQLDPTFHCRMCTRYRADVDVYDMETGTRDTLQLAKGLHALSTFLH